jgi:G:T-mismatch repair DNA endonuclease (very short patch repair protein)
LEGIIKNHAGNTFPCTLDNFINKYGIEKGTEVYNKRCERISYASSINFYIDKYGDVEGEKIWKNKFRQIRVSKSSSKINKLLDDLCLNYESEKNINGKFLDFYLNDYNIGIEFFGDYWHMNPKLYLPNEYNKRLKKTSSEIWETDDIRIDKIKEKCSSIIIIWESTNIDILLLEKTINDIKDKKIIIYL